MLHLPMVTLACIDTNHPNRGATAVARSMRHIQFGAAKFFSPVRPKHLPAKCEHVRIDPFPYVRQYSQFCLKELHKHMPTSHCLIVQSDGFVRNPRAWTHKFLDYDYIGSPWPAWDAEKQTWAASGGWITGNGGFSLRSLKFLTAVSKLPYPMSDGPSVSAEDCEDWFCCIVHRRTLEDQGIRFAPPDLAAWFAFDCHRHDGPWPHDYRLCFGFHSDQAKNLLKQQYGIDVLTEP